MIDHKRLRLPIMGLALIVLTGATWAGFLRLGWQWPALQPSLPINHGPLMIAGFFSTLIALERAVAIGKSWTYIGPILSGVGGLLIVFGIPGSAGPVFMTLGSLSLVVVFAVILRDHRSDYMIVMALGAVALLIGNLLWLLGWQVHQFVLWWAGFLILTIAGERLELGRMVQKPKYSQPLFYLIALIYITGLVFMLFSRDAGVRISSVGTMALAIWLLSFDIARQTIKRTGLTRFIAVCLLSGYVWLIISGLVGLVYGAVPAGPIYDTMLHSILLGFVFSMVFGHALIIFPAVLELNIEFKPQFYYPLILLHASLILRTAGELSGLAWTRLWGGLLNAIAVMIYLVMISPITQIQNN
jgi:hypothetical protein